MYLDETGSSLKTTVVKTCAPRGQTPTVATKLDWKSLSIIAALSSDGRLFQRTHEHAVYGVDVVAFLRHLLRHVAGEVTVVLDRAAIHRAKCVQAFVLSEPRLSLVFLPAYAPECNPVELLWAYVKRNILGNVCCRTLHELRRHWGRGWHRVRQLRLVSSWLHV
ncbi:IS630 family transposase [Deinococcus pimensis]|uniref:IS630 family transposase n=1 Tax=Deinococcus pimensis TaxID=309888 RepID=UPI0005EBB9CC|nr:IS630 family transposase [Deinococcus pimensis]